MAPGLTDEQIAQLLEQATRTEDPTNPTGSGAPAPITYRIGNTTFTAKTPEEQQQQIDAAMQQIGNSVQQQLTAAQQAAQAPPKAPKAPKAPEIDREHFAKLFLEDPAAAFDYVDEHRYGMKNPAAAIKATIGDVGAMEQSLAVQQFLGSAQDYEATPENFQALASTLTENGLAWNAKGLMSAFKLAKAEGRIRAAEAEPEPQQNYFQRGGPPVVSRRGAQVNSGTVDNDLMARYESLTPEQMKSFIDKLERGGS